ncbi:MAG: tetratricopeptide repeat protein [Nitrospiraceae bacterium]|nr:tetratricopeptide repeat protein [Nitrospiraceae bacterium]
MNIIRFVISIASVFILSACASDMAMFGNAYLNQKNYDAAISNFQAAANMEPGNAYYQFMTGRAYHEKGSYKEAIPYFEKAVKLSPNANYYNWLAHAYFYNNRASDALATAKKALDLNSTDNSTVKQLLMLHARASDSMGQTEAAVSSMNRYIALDPNDSAGFSSLGYYLNNQQKYDEAITATKRAIELKQDDETAYNNLGYSYGQKEQYDEAFKYFDKALSINPKSLLANKNIGYFNVERRNYEGAVAAIKKAIEISPDDYGSYNNLSIAYLNMGRFDEALVAVDKSISFTTFSGIGAEVEAGKEFVVIKSAHKNLPADKAGIKSGDKIVSIDSISMKNKTVAEVVQKMRGEPGTALALEVYRGDGAESIIKNIIREKISDNRAADAYGIRSVILREKGSLEQAYQDAKTASLLNPASSWAIYSLGIAYLDKGMYDESVEMLARLTYDAPVAKLFSATATAKKGDLKAAVEKYIKIPPSKLSSVSVPTSNARKAFIRLVENIKNSHLSQASEYESRTRYIDAVNELSRALVLAEDASQEEALRSRMFSVVRRMPSPPEITEQARRHVLRGELLVKDKNMPDAVNEYRKAISLAPYSAKLYFNLALICGEIKKYDDAISNMKIYLQAAPDAPNARAARDEIIKWELMQEKATGKR